MIQVTCVCGATMQVQDDNAGKQCKCPKCEAICQIPAEGEAAPATATPPPTPAPPGVAAAPPTGKSPSGPGWYFEVLKKYTVFTGRARRQEYWFFVLFNMLISMAIGFIEGAMGSPGIAGNVYTLAVFLPSLAVGIRRMHDTDHSGWWVLVPIVNLVFACTDGTAGDNRFGPDSKR